MGVIGQTFGKYSLILKLASGGQGEIYLARQQGDAGFEKLVVIKRLLPHLAEDLGSVKMLVDEARIVARLDHVNVAQVYELGEADGSYYLAMEYLEGVSLSRILQHAADRGELLDIRLVTAILQQACEGLHHAHELKDDRGERIGVVHRDVSPSNLFVTVDGYVKVLDFGVAKARGMGSRTRTGAIKGKYEYMSPEQVLRRPLDRRSDVFSLGIVLYESLAVRRLFYRDSEYEVFRAITDDPIPSLGERRPDAPAALVDVYWRALARDMDKRLASAREFRRALMDATVELGPPLTVEEIGEYVRANFADEIESRRDAVAVNIRRIERRATRQKELAPATNPGPASRPGASATAEEFATDIGDDSTVLHTTERDTGRPMARRPALLVWILACVLVAALGAMAVLVYRAGRVQAPAVIVEQGAVTAEDGRVVESPRHPRDPYVDAFRVHQAGVRDCLDDHAGEQPDKLVFDIAADGRVDAAWLEPETLTETPLGRCITALARNTRFSPRGKRVIVRIQLQIY